MSFQNDDLFLVNRGGDSFKTEYVQLKQSINEENGVHVDDSPPADPSDGDLWFNSDDGRLYVWYVTETTGIVTSVSTRNGGSGYTTDATGVETIGGSGTGLTVDIQAGIGGNFANPTVNLGGHSYRVGDVAFVTGAGHGNGSVSVTAVNSAPVGQWVDASPDSPGAADLWERDGSTLKPVNAGDDVQIASLNTGQLGGFRNVLINGTVTINQRTVTYAAASVGEYWADRWKKTAGGMTQIVEEGNYQPSTQYTLSGNGVTTQQITSPASGHWTIPDVPATATNIQLEPGPVATPFEHRHIGAELALAQRYYQLTIADQTGYNGDGSSVGYYMQVDYKVEMRAAPTALFTSTSESNINGTFVDGVNRMACLKGCRVAATGSYTSYGILTLDAEL